MTRLLILLLISTLQLSAIEKSDILGLWTTKEKTVEESVTIDMSEYVSYKADGTCSSEVSINLTGENYDIQGYKLEATCFWKLYKNIMVIVIEDIKVANQGTTLKADSDNSSTKELLNAMVKVMQSNPIVIDEIISLENNTITTIDEDGVKSVYKRLPKNNKK